MRMYCTLWAPQLRPVRKRSADFFLFELRQSEGWLSCHQVDSRLDKDSSINLAYMFSTCLLFGWFGFPPLLATRHLLVLK